MELTSNPRKRALVFISHARPDDDELTRWLCGRLTARGYKVWADLEQLLGGDRFWSDIQRAIREDTARFITLMTHASVGRDGVLDELAEAVDTSKKLNDKKFIIPIRADNIPWSDFPIQLKQMNGLDFSEDWMRNFHALLKTLESGDVPCIAGDPEVARNAELLVRSRQTIQRTSERALLNRLSIAKLPSDVRYFLGSMSARDLAVAAPRLSVPCAAHDRLLISFADLETLKEKIPPETQLEIENRHTTSLDSFMSGTSNRGPQVVRQQAHNHLSAILRSGFENYLRAAGLVQFDRRWFVPRDWRKDNEARYWRADGKEAYRVLVGKSKEQTWHFAISFKIFTSEPRRIQIIPHVLFSNDGVTPLADQKQMRRKRCKLWWNDRWRDLLVSFCSELFGHHKKSALINLGGSANMEVTTSLAQFELPVSYASEDSFIPDADDSLDAAEDGDTVDSEDSADDEGINA